MKGLGVRAGVPDLCCIRDGRAFFLELKSAGGRLSPAQIATHSLLVSAGAMVATVDSLDDALRWLECQGLLRGTMA
jgi:hypothetical protein